MFLFVVCLLPRPGSPAGPRTADGRRPKHSGDSQSTPTSTKANHTPNFQSEPTPYPTGRFTYLSLDWCLIYLARRRPWGSERPMDASRNTPGLPERTDQHEDQPHSELPERADPLPNRRIYLPSLLICDCLLLGALRTHSACENHPPQVQYKRCEVYLRAPSL